MAIATIHRIRLVYIAMTVAVSPIVIGWGGVMGLGGHNGCLVLGRG